MWLGIPKPMIPYPLLGLGVVQAVGTHVGRIPNYLEVPDTPPPPAHPHAPPIAPTKTPLSYPPAPPPGGLRPTVSWRPEPRSWLPRAALQPKHTKASWIVQNDQSRHSGYPVWDGLQLVDHLSTTVPVVGQVHRRAHARDGLHRAKGNVQKRWCQKSLFTRLSSQSP